MEANELERLSYNASILEGKEYLILTDYLPSLNIIKGMKEIY